MTRLLDLRCPVDQRRMFGRIVRMEGIEISDNLIEFACDRCRKITGSAQVLHRFDFGGRLVETISLEQIPEPIVSD